MRVAIDASALGSGRGGDETYLRGLLLGLAEITDPARDAYPLLVPADVALPGPLRGSPAFPVHRIPRGRRLVRYLVTVPRVLRQRGDAELLYTQVHAPLGSPAPIALYVADLSFFHLPRLFPLRERLRFNALVPLHIRAARIVVTPSEFSRRDLIATYRLDPARVRVVPCAVVPPDVEPLGDAAGPTVGPEGPGGPFFLYVGNLHPRKNVPRLIEAFARARRNAPALAEHRLVIAGGRWWGEGEERAARAAPPGSIVFLGRVTDAERWDLMARAQALVYPSLFEGFGLPPVEAMALGTPVLAANTTAMPEVLGEAALLVDPRDTEAIARGLARLAAEPALRAELARRGRARAARYTPRATAEAARAAFHAALRR